MELVYKYAYGDEAYGLVYRNAAGDFEVFEIPQYGGDEQLQKTFSATDYDAATEYAESFT